jgi:hypothetical protein
MFYKYQDDVLLSGNVVTTPTFELTIETRGEFSYPVDGWVWFETEEEAQAHFGIVNAETA